MLFETEESEFYYSPLGFDPDLADVVAAFVEEMPTRVAELRGHFENSEWPELRRAAHQLRGSAGSYGFSALTPLAANLENAVKRSSPVEQIKEALDALAEDCEKVRAGIPF